MVGETSRIREQHSLLLLSALSLSIYIPRYIVTKQKHIFSYGKKLALPISFFFFFQRRASCLPMQPKVVYSCDYINDNFSWDKTVFNFMSQKMK